MTLLEDGRVEYRLTNQTTQKETQICQQNKLDKIAKATLVNCLNCTAINSALSAFEMLQIEYVCLHLSCQIPLHER